MALEHGQDCWSRIQDKWLPKSPDLNPTERIGDALKQKWHKMFLMPKQWTKTKIIFSCLLKFICFIHIPIWTHKPEVLKHFLMLY